MQRAAYNTCISVRRVPEWLPGAGWKKAVAEQRETFLAMVELPFKWVRGQMVSPGAQGKRNCMLTP